MVKNRTFSTLELFYKNDPIGVVPCGEHESKKLVKIEKLIKADKFDQSETVVQIWKNCQKRKKLIQIEKIDQRWKIWPALNFESNSSKSKKNFHFYITYLLKKKVDHDHGGEGRGKSVNVFDHVRSKGSKNVKNLITWYVNDPLI